jgi:hypothetical protein
MRNSAALLRIDAAKEQRDSQFAICSLRSQGEMEATDTNEFDKSNIAKACSDFKRE